MSYLTFSTAVAVDAVRLRQSSFSIRQRTLYLSRSLSPMKRALVRRGGLGTKTSKFNMLSPSSCRLGKHPCPYKPGSPIRSPDISCQSAQDSPVPSLSVSKRRKSDRSALSLPYSQRFRTRQGLFSGKIQRLAEARR